MDWPETVRRYHAPISSHDCHASCCLVSRRCAALERRTGDCFRHSFFYLLAIVLRRSKRVIEQYDGVKISDVGQELAHN